MADGWGRGAWGSGVWGTGSTAGVLLSNISAAGAVGSPTVVFGSSARPTTVSATGSVSSLNVVQSIVLSGVSTQGVVGSVFLWSAVQTGAPGSWSPVAHDVVWYLVTDAGEYLVTDDGSYLVDDVTSPDASWTTLAPSPTSGWTPVI